MLPSNRPAQAREKTASILFDNGVRDVVAVLAVRGYYRDTMGVKGQNDIGIYDDAIFLNSPWGHISYNANTDPSIHRDRIATLKPGLYLYRKGRHGINREKRGGAPAYPAFVQADEVTVLRYNNGMPRLEDTGYFGINIHKGSRNSTSSEGCQTIHPDQWESFITVAYDWLDRAQQLTLPYLLIENK